MLSKEQVRRFMSLSTHNQLTKQLTLLEKPLSRREEADVRGVLRNAVSRLFTYKEIYDLHDDHVAEMAEVVVALYTEQERLTEYIDGVCSYAEKQMAKLDERRLRCGRRLDWERKKQVLPPEKLLDLQYEYWTYTDGYYHGRKRAYKLLVWALRDVKAWMVKENLWAKSRAGKKA